MGSAIDAIAGAKERLAIARNGLADMKVKERSRAGLMNAVVFGRMVTFQLQNMSSGEPDFSAWWEDRRRDMRDDPVFKRCNDLRTEIEKTSTPSIGLTTMINFNPFTDTSAFGPPPPGAVGQFIGDQYGRSGWVVRTSDGEEVEYYVDLPEQIARSYHTVEIDGVNREASEVIREYLDKLDGLIEAAEVRFTAANSSTRARNSDASSNVVPFRRRS